MLEEVKEAVGEFAFRATVQVGCASIMPDLACMTLLGACETRVNDGLAGGVPLERNSR